MRHRPDRRAADPPAAPAVLTGRTPVKPIIPILLALSLGAGPALAQQSEEQARATAVILPIVQEVVPGYTGQVVAACIIANAAPEEKATIAAAPGPSNEIGALMTSIMGRQPTIDCVESTLGN